MVGEDGIQVRYLKLTVLAVPYDQPAAISGLRVFGIGDGEKPAVPTFTAERLDDLDMKVAITSDDADVTGYNILWGHAEDKLYHSYMIFGKKGAEDWRPDQGNRLFCESGRLQREQHYRRRSDRSLIRQETYSINQKNPVRGRYKVCSRAGSLLITRFRMPL